MFSIISHDLRSPFGTILGLSEILADEIDTLSKDEIAEYVSNIKLAAQNSYDLMDKLLFWARSQTGDIRLIKEQVNLKNLVNDAVGVLEHSANNKKISIKNVIGAEILALADNNTLNAVIRNLIANAIKYTKENGIIEISAEIKDGYAEVKVSDNGIGMNEYTLKNLFNRSEAVSRPGTANESGTGLGLILCKEFIEQNGGTLRAESKEGAGSVFIFTLPYLRN